MCAHRISRFGKSIFSSAVVVMVFFAWSAVAEEKAGAAPAAAMSPPSVLFLSAEPLFDKQYAEELKGQGINYAAVSYYEPLAPAFMKRFNTYVLDMMPSAGGEWETFGQRLIQFRANFAEMMKNVEAGAGALIYPNLADGGGGMCLFWNQAMKPYGIQMQQACVLDRSLCFRTWSGFGTNGYSWTENIVKHPATEGIARIYYAGANLRWDDLYTTPPLICGKEWTPIVKAMSGARIGTMVSGKWLYEPDPMEDIAIAAVREYGKGRLGVLAISPAYIHRLGYTKLEKDWYGEQCFGPIDGIVIAKGDGRVPSDTGKLAAKLYSWLAGDSAAKGFGGYKSGEPVEKIPHVATEEEKAFTPVVDFETVRMPQSWRHRPTRYQLGDKTYFPEFADPYITGELKYMKGLVGARTGLSSGTGTVAEFAAAARQAGYSMIVFTEDFEKLPRQNWNQLVKECEANTGDDLVCLPGFDIMDPEGNHLLVIGPPYYPRSNWLSPDGKRLKEVQMINLLYGNHIVVAHRPSTGPLPPERLKHFQGQTVYTYRNGKLEDESFGAYAWQVMNGSNPHPVAVHEVFSPDEIAKAAATGFQQILPADTPQNAASYFRSGIGHYFDCPARYMISEGPIVYNWVIYPKDFGPAEENRMHFRVDIGVRSDKPLRSVTLYDGFTPIRRWLPQGNDFQVRADFQHAKQYDLFLTAEDNAGRRVLVNGMRTVAGRYHNRCSDRQNWLGHVGIYYTGTYLQDGLTISLPIKGTDEASSIFTNTPGTSMAMKVNYPFTCNDVVLTECIFDEKYLTALFSDVGFDARPSLGSKPSSVYDATVRRWSFTPGKDKSPFFTMVEMDIVLKRDVEPRQPGALFPVIASTGGKNYAWPGSDGKLTTGEFKPGAINPIPAGGMAGGVIVLSEGLAEMNGQIGFANSAEMLPAGKSFRARLLMPGCWKITQGVDKAFSEAPEKWLKDLGLLGQAPYQLKLTRGKAAKQTFPAEFAAENGGVAGEVAQTAELPFLVPMAVSGINTKWPAGIWREDGGLVYAGSFEGRAWPRIDVGKKGAFYAGNLVSADNQNLVLEFVKWTPDAVKIEVHNPTAAPIEATVSTAPEVKGLKALSRKVTVPPGTTQYLE